MNYKGFITTLINPPMARVTLGTSQTIADLTFDNIDWDTEEIATTGMWSSSTNPDRLIAPKDGVYLAIFNAYWVDGVNGTRRVHLIKKNGTTSIAKSTKDANDNTADTIAAITKLNKDDYVVGRVLHNNGGNLDFRNIQNGLSLHWLGELP